METRCRQLALQLTLAPRPPVATPRGPQQFLGSLSDGATVELLERFLWGDGQRTSVI